MSRHVGGTVIRLSSELTDRKVKACHDITYWLCFAQLLMRLGRVPGTLPLAGDLFQQSGHILTPAQLLIYPGSSMISANWTTALDVTSAAISLTIVLAISLNSSFCIWGLVKSM